MNSINAKSIRRDTQKQQREDKLAKMKLPNDYEAHLKNPYVQNHRNGEFINDIYHQYSPAFIAWVYIRNIVLFLIPAIMIHSPLLLIKTVYWITFSESLYLSFEPFFLLLVYGGALMLAIGRIQRQMAYYNTMALNGRRNINTIRANSNSITPNGTREVIVLDHVRMKLNKTHLFQSNLEASVDAQVNGEFADNSSNKTSEHYAAKAVADRKQRETGGINEYDQMVRRYKRRTTPAIRNIIKQVQKSN